MVDLGSEAGVEFETGAGLVPDLQRLGFELDSLGFDFGTGFGCLAVVIRFGILGEGFLWLRLGIVELILFFFPWIWLNLPSFSPDTGLKNDEIFHLHLLNDYLTLGIVAN